VTADQHRILVTAIRIAAAGAESPIRTFATLIPAHLIEQLRHDLTAMGVEWRAAG
jgi:hypothetical protein